MAIANAAFSRATTAQATAQASALRSVGNVGIRLFGGRTFNAFSLPSGATTGTTFEVMTTTALPFDAVRIIYAMGNTSSLNAVTPAILASVAVVGDTSDATLAAASWSGVTFGGANGFGGAALSSLPPPPAAYDRRAFLLSDIIPLPSVARSDGGAFPLLVTRAWLTQTSGATASIVISGNGTQSFANWASHPSGRIWRMLNKGGGFAANGQSGMSSVNSAVGTGSPIAGVVYYARGKVVNVVGVGDSITEGEGSYVGEGFGFPACNALSQGAAGVAYEWSDLGWAGTTTAQMRQNLIDGLSMGLRWDVGVLPGGSPNDVTTTITAAQIAQARFRTSHMIDLMRQAGIAPVLWTWLPSSTSAKPYGASDSLRRALNDDYRGWAGHGAVIADFDSVLAGASDANGQTQFRPGVSDDAIHPNDAGNALLSPVLQQAVQALFRHAPGMVMRG